MGDDKPTVRDNPSAPPRVREHSSDRYEAGEEIARGGMGRVVEAHDTLLGRTVAVKEALSTDPEALRRFTRETHITARLEHPSIVPVYDAGTAPDGSPYYVMRKVSGRPLSQLVKQSLAERLALIPNVLAAAQAVAHAHRRGVLHRDLKPSNILVGDFGETIVIDWGLAKVVGEEDEPDDPQPRAALAGDSLRTRVGVIFGTPGFMSPQQVRGEPVDARGDVYALGATLYYVLAMHAPHAAADSDAMMKAALEGPPTPIAKIVDGIPRELSTIVDKALAYDDAARYADAGELAEDLQRFLTGKLVAAHDYSTRERLMRFVRKHRIAVTAVTLALVVLAIGGTIAVRSVIAERDRADAQARLAIEGQRRADDRADQLLLTQAEMLVTTNPTASIAVLKSIAATPERWAKWWRHARAIAENAKLAGVAVGMPGPEHPVYVEVSPDQTHAIARGDDGEIWIADLAHRTSKLLAQMGSVNIKYLDDQHILAYWQDTIHIIDATTGVSREVSVAANIYEIATTPKISFITDVDTRTLSTIDLATGHLTALPYKNVLMIEVSLDQTRMLVLAGDATYHFDLSTTPPTVTKVAPGDAVMAAWNAKSTGFVIGYKTNVGWFPDGKQPIWLDPPSMPLGVVALEDAPLVLGSYNGFVTLEHGKQIIRASRLSTSSLLPRLLDHNRVVAAVHNDLLVVDGQREILLRSPGGGAPRVAAGPISDRIVAGVPGHILMWDLQAIAPSGHLVAEEVNAAFILSATDIIVALRNGFDYMWIDLAAKQMTPLALPPLALFETNGRRDRMIVRSEATPGAWLLERGNKQVRALGNDIDAAGFGDNEILWLTDFDGSITGYDEDRTVRYRHKAPGHMLVIAWGGDWFGGTIEGGKLWRWNIRTNEENILDAHLAVPPRSIRLLANARMFVPVDDAVWRWEADGTFHSYVTLPSRVENLISNHNILLAQIGTGAGYRIGLDEPTATSVFPDGTTKLHMSDDVNLGVMELSNSVTEIVDLEVGRQWPLLNRDAFMPIQYPSLSADGTALIGLVAGSAYLWRLTLPPDAEATRRWLDELTNAIADMGPTTVTWR